MNAIPTGFPRELIDTAILSGTEYAWTIPAFPGALEIAERFGLACLGGVFHMLPPDGEPLELSWLDYDSEERLTSEPWADYVRRSCDEVRAVFGRMVADLDRHLERAAAKWPSVAAKVAASQVVYVAYFELLRNPIAEARRPAPPRCDVYEYQRRPKATNVEGAGPVVRVVYPARDGVEREIPFVIGVIADLSGDRVPPPLGQRRFAKVSLESFDSFLASCKPHLSFEIYNVPDRCPSRIGLEFESMEDFEPHRIVLQAEPLRRLLAERGKYPGEKEWRAVLSRQLDAILHAPAFQKLEATWRGLQLLVSRAGTSDLLWVEALNASQRDLAADLQDRESSLQRLIASGGSGCSPFSLLVGDIEFGLTELDLLAKLGRIAEGVHAPYLAGAGPTLFGVVEFAGLEHQSSPMRFSSTSGKRGWTEILESDSGMYLALTMPRMRLRAPYWPSPANPHASEVPYEESVFDDTPEGQLWGSAAWAYAGRFAQLFAADHWCAEAALIEDLPSGPPGSGKFGFPLDFLADVKELRSSGFRFDVEHAHASEDFAEAGFLVCAPLTLNGRPFESARFETTLQNDASLAEILCLLRFALYLKAIVADRAPYRSLEHCAWDLNEWIAGYVSGSDAASPERPLSKAYVEVLPSRRSGPFVALQAMPRYNHPRRLMLQSSLTLPPGAVPDPLRREIEEYMSACGVPFEWNPDEQPVAVVWIQHRESVRALGEALRDWLASRYRLGHIIGLQRMLDGRLPECTGFLRHMGSASYPDTWTCDIALVTTDLECPKHDWERRNRELVEGLAEVALAYDATVVGVALRSWSARAKPEVLGRTGIAYRDGRGNARELPFVIGVIADLGESSGQRRFVRVDGNNIDSFLADCRPRIAFEIEDISDGSRARVDLTFESIDDFEPDRIARRVEPVRRLVAGRERHPKRAAEWDAAIARQLDEVFRAPEFRRLATAWRGLHLLVTRTEISDRIWIEVLNVSRRELDGVLNLLERRPARGELFAPFSLLVGDMEFGPGREDMELLEKLGSIAAAIHAPFIAASSPALFGADAFAELESRRDISSPFEFPSYWRWKRIRKKESAKYLALTMPRMRLGQRMWGSAAWAFASSMAATFAELRWFGGPGRGHRRIDGLPPASPYLGRLALPVDYLLGTGAAKASGFTVAVPHECQEFSRLGFTVCSPLDGCERPFETAVFHEPVSLFDPGMQNNPTDATAAQEAVSLPVTLAMSRLAHTVQALAAELPPCSSIAECERALNEWIADYTCGDRAAAGRPFQRAWIEVRHVHPGVHEAVIHAVPALSVGHLRTSPAVVATLPPDTIPGQQRLSGS